MNTVVMVNLGGNAYHLEEAGFALLGDYLGSARWRLQGNPDIEEILSDLELALADKMHRFLNANKNVVTTGEVEQVVDEMGPVDSPLGTGSAEEAVSRSAPTSIRARAPEAKNRLYKLTGENDKMLTGVCAGLAAYLSLDVSIVRIAFIALGLATSGLAVIGYLALALIVPTAETPQQQAAAYGVPFDARGVIDQAKSKLGKTEAGREWRAQQRYWNRRARSAGFNGIGGFLGLGAVFFGLLIGLYFFANVASWFSPAGYVFPPELSLWQPQVIRRELGATPWWLGLLILIAGVYLMAAMASGRRRDRRSAMGTLLSVILKAVLVLLLFWLAYETLPLVRDVVHGLFGVHFEVGR